MTTPETPTPKAAGGAAGRVKRSPPGRAGPRRSASTASAAKPAPEPAADRPEAATASSVPVSDAIADAVRRGYQVIGENIEQGRAAAEQFRAGQYSIRDVPYDLNQMALRLLTLTRELSTTACDILEKVLRDPSLAAGMQRRSGAEEGQPDAAPASAPRTSEPPSFRPAPPPPGPGPAAAPPRPRLGSAAPGPASAPQPATPAPGGPRATPPPVRLDVELSGKAAVVRAATLTPPDPPSPIVAPGLLAADASAPAIRAITFAPGADPLSMTVKIAVPADQPAGVYSGVICAAETQVPLGAIAIEVTG